MNNKQEGQKRTRTEENNEGGVNAVNAFLCLGEGEWKKLRSFERRERISEVVEAVKSEKKWSSLEATERSVIVSRAPQDKRALLPAYNYKETVEKRNELKLLFVRAMEGELFDKTTEGDKTVYEATPFTYQQVICKNFELFKWMWNDKEYNEFFVDWVFSGQMKELEVDAMIALEEDKEEERQYQQAVECCGGSNVYL